MRVGIVSCALLICAVLIVCQPACAAGAVQQSVAGIGGSGGGEVHQTALASAFPSSGVYVVFVDAGRITEMKKISDTLPDPSKVDASASVSAAQPKAAAGPFTSLIIDARGCRVDRAMSPKIRKTDGSEVWGTISVLADYAIEDGVVGYATSMEMATKSSRWGGNPLVIKAVGRPAGGPTCDVVISDDDAKRAVAENGVSKFLDGCRVVFVVD